MKRILLVDDDFLALNAFFTLADWNKHGLYIAHEAHNAQEALDYLRNHRPDIAFIDICMPDMDGISLLLKIRQIDPSILCIMLSSHSDYPYVREALKHGAADYLLKHEITRDSILAILQQHGVDTNPSIVKEDTATRLFSLLTEHQLESESLSGLLVLGYLSEGLPPIEVQQNSIHQTCRHILNDCPGAAVCSPCSNELAILLPGDALSTSLDAAQKHIVRIKKALEKYHHMTYVFTPVKHCADSAQMGHAYQLFHSRYLQDSSVMKSAQKSDENIALMLAVINHQKPLIEKLVHILYANAAASNDICSFGREILSLFLHLKQLLNITGGAIPRLPAETSQWESFSIRVLSDLAEYDVSDTTALFSRTIQQALDYLHEHYSGNIRLNDVARHCNVSYNHLSFLFKKETSENIISYLNQLRVYHAARLILFDSLPVSTVSEKVGFNCYNHFFITFRDITGMAPSEFRKNEQAVEWIVKLSHTLRRGGMTGNPQ